MLCKADVIPLAYCKMAVISSVSGWAAQFYKQSVKPRSTDSWKTDVNFCTRKSASFWCTTTNKCLRFIFQANLVKLVFKMPGFGALDDNHIVSSMYESISGGYRCCVCLISYVVARSVKHHIRKHHADQIKQTVQQSVIDGSFESEIGKVPHGFIILEFL